MGLLLPRGVVQPFEILFSRDDLHVIVNLTDHPAYEAVEAMVRLLPGRPPRVRAIITRHDQTQVDRLELHHLRVADSADDEGGVVLAFTEHDAALGIDSETTLVTGTYAIEPDGAIVIRPGQPTWATRRPLRVQFAAIADGHLITTRIGGPASA